MSRAQTRRRIWVIGLAAILAVVPAMAFASHGFEDVPDDHTFHDDIAWMQETGVTRGCNPPENTEYCPERGLTRGEEAAFFHRYDGYLRDSLEMRLLPEECEEGQVAEFDGEAWQCADTGTTGGLEVAMGDAFAIDPAETQTGTAVCADGQVAVAGGVTPLNDDMVVSVTLAGATAEVTVTNGGVDPIEVTPHAICASA